MASISRRGKWERMFSRRLLSVVDMDPAYLAKHDGSEQAAGRGSGREGEDVLNEGKPDPGLARGIRPNMTPYMQMTYAPQERRLDIAIFRALFASSARQARQFVVHGAVKVNGVKVSRSLPAAGSTLLISRPLLTKIPLDGLSWIPAEPWRHVPG